MSLFTPEALAEPIKMVQEGEISGKMGKEVFEEMYKTGRSASMEPFLLIAVYL
ncbi:MAG: hypothetical protein HY887_03635 [Deltaproteobacteria bacterium]|nr:hypothetical protein [Deltaproteobacteria bacterium]